MEIGPDDIHGLPDEIGPTERKVSVRKLLVTLVVILITGALLVPLISFALEAGWLPNLTYVFFVLLLIGYGLDQYLKSRR